MDERTAYLGFNLVSGIGPGRVRMLVTYCGSASAAWLATTDDWRAAGLDRRSIAALEAGRQQIDFEQEWQAIECANIQVVLETDAAYPEALRSIYHPPTLLYMRGTIVAADRWAVAIVGTRNPSAYGREVAYSFAQELAQNGLTIISGLAYGIDAQAHQAALDHEGRTIAVLGSGLVHIYPSKHRTLADAISQSGALISEYAPTLQPLSGNFPARNRLISGLAMGTLVVEAGTRSGALITARFALDQGREVFAVPGSIWSRTSAGTHQLLIEGAHLTQTVQDILDALAIQQTFHQAATCVPETPAEALLIPLLQTEPMHIDQLCRASGLSAADTAATLGMMELKGMVRQLHAMVFTLVRSVR